VAVEHDAAAVTRRRVPPPPTVPAQRRLVDVVVVAVVLAVLVWAWQGAEMRPMDLWIFRSNMAEFLSDFLEPDFRRWEVYIEQMIVTVQIAIWGTVLAVVLSVPLSVLCADNVVPAWVHFPVRRLMDAARAINEVVFAILFVVAVGLGPFAGTLAIFVHTTGVLAKLFSEAV
jgi:phosphonate transport system permease protein